jgi:hypothetical protein
LVASETPENWRGGITEEVKCSRILIVAPISTASHIFVYASYAKGLAERCHKVLYIIRYLV